MKKNLSTTNKSKTIEWLNELKPKDWLVEEYKILSSHYFHEDGQIQKTITIYSAFNGAFLAFIGSKFYQDDAITGIFIPLIGITLCFSWVATLVRLREWRMYIENRIKFIEETLHSVWKDYDFIPLDLRTVKAWKKWRPRIRWYNWPYYIFRDLPSSLSLMILPVAFTIVWLYLLFIGFNRI
ncbi:MAG: hypothetical protein MI685_11535 [Chlorobiales bacterium]|nr:hypothetical protein [Chlorobiales bacterium]